MIEVISETQVKIGRKEACLALGVAALAVVAVAATLNLRPRLK